MRNLASSLLGFDTLEALNNSLAALEARRAATVERINALEPSRREFAVEAAGGDTTAQSELQRANGTLEAEQRALNDLDLAIDGLRARILAAERQKAAEVRAQKRQVLNAKLRERDALVAEIEASMRKLAATVPNAGKLADEIRALHRELLGPGAPQFIDDPLDPHYVRVRLVEFGARLGLAWWFDNERLAGSVWVGPETFIKSEAQAHAKYNGGE